MGIVMHLVNDIVDGGEFFINNYLLNPCNSPKTRHILSCIHGDTGEGLKHEITMIGGALIESKNTTQFYSSFYLSPSSQNTIKRLPYQANMQRKWQILKIPCIATCGRHTASYFAIIRDNYCDRHQLKYPPSPRPIRAKGKRPIHPSCGPHTASSSAAIIS